MLVLYMLHVSYQRFYNHLQYLVVLAAKDGSAVQEQPNNKQGVLSNHWGIHGEYIITSYNP